MQRQMMLAIQAFVVLCVFPAHSFFHLLTQIVVPVIQKCHDPRRLPEHGIYLLRREYSGVYAGTHTMLHMGNCLVFSARSFWSILLSFRSSFHILASISISATYA